MPIISHGGKIKEVSVGSTSINKIFYGSRLVWQKSLVGQDLEIIKVPPLTTTTQMKNFIDGELARYGTTRSSVVNLPFGIDLTDVNHNRSMFDGCTNLRSIPAIINTSKVASFYQMFRDCPALISLPDMDVTGGTSFSSMFQGCSSLADGGVRLIRTDGVNPTNVSLIISGTKMTRAPFFDGNGNPI